MELAGQVRIEAVDDDVVAVVLEGEHDLGTAADLRDALANSASAGKRILIDLGPTTFVDSSILGAILEARRTAREENRGLAVAAEGSAEPVTRVLDVTGLGTELPVHSTRDEAIAALAPSQTP